MAAKPTRKTTPKTNRKPTRETLGKRIATSPRVQRKPGPVRARSTPCSAAPPATNELQTHDPARDLRERLGMTRPIFARIVGVSERTVAAWESGSQPSLTGGRALSQLRSVVEACERVMQPDYVGTWLVTPNDALGGLKAIECIERGETERVLRVLFFWEAGIPL